MAEKGKDCCTPFVTRETHRQVRVRTVSFLVWILAVFVSARQIIN